MSYTLYISDHCPSCDQAIEYLEGAKISFDTVDLDDMEKRPENILIVPALSKDGKLLAFGPDIPSFFNKKSA